jgi:hypothetical protein
MANNDAIIPGGTLTVITDQIKQGRNGGNWLGTGGITSSSAATIFADNSNAHKTALAAVLASAVGLSVIDGQNVDPASVILRYTYLGDANVDGKVNALDYNAVATNFGSTGKTWSDGDFNYDGTVNTLDFTALGTNFNIAPLPSISLGTLVPEPSSVAACGLIASALLRRRKRQAR